MPANSRTYGKRSSVKRKSTHEPGDSDDDDKKRPRIAGDDGSPSRPARDLSLIFAAISPSPSQASSSGSPTRLSKRMLGRSKTEPVIESTLSYVDKRSPSLPSHVYSPLRPPSTPVKGLSSLARTYAGKSRSYLAPGVADDAEDEFSRESYTTLRERWGVDSEDEPSPSSKGKGKARTTKSASASPSKPALPNNMMNPLKSITELRNKGESRRFLDEVAYLLDGMGAAQGPRLITASALEITTKLCDTAFFRKAKAADIAAPVLKLFLSAGAGRGDDKTLDAIFLCFAALIARDPPSLADLVQDPQTASSLVDALFTILASTTRVDPLVLVRPHASSDAELRKAGLGKKDKSVLISISTAIANKSGLFPSRVRLSTPLLITYTLQRLAPTLLAPKHLPSLLASLRAVLSQSASSTASGSSSTQVLDPSTFEFEAVLGHLRLLDLYLLGQWGSGGGESMEAEGQENGARVKESNERVLAEARESWLVDELGALGVCADAGVDWGCKRNWRKRRKVRHTQTWKGGDTEDEDSDNGGGYDDGDDGAVKCLESVLRVLVSLTHSDEVWARRLVFSSVKQGDSSRATGDQEGNENVVSAGNETMLWLMRVVARAGEEVASGRGVKVGTRTGRVGVITKDGDVGEDQDASGEQVGEGESGSGRERSARALDGLCLALALLTNLVQSVGEVKDLVREKYLEAEPASQRARKGGKRSERRTALDILVELYAQQQPLQKEESLDADADAAFLRGHLAVLFGLLMRGNERNRQMVLALLPSPPSTGLVKAKTEARVKLTRLLDQARGFVAFFAVVVRGQLQVEEDDDAGNVAQNDGETSSRIAREIVGFLEELRDNA